MNIKTYKDYDELKTIHVFDVYDFPLFFISISPNEEIFLHYFIDEDLEAEMTIWFISHITQRELDSILHKHISSLDILDKLLKNNRLFKLSLLDNPKNPNLGLVFDQLNEVNYIKDEFPTDHFFAEYDYLNDEELIYIEKTSVDSSSFTMTLRDSENSHDLPIETLIKACNFMRKTVNKTADYIVDSLDEISRKSGEIVSIKVAAFQESSFAILFKTDDHDLFNVSNDSLDIVLEYLDDFTNNNFSRIEEKIDIDKRYPVEMIKETNKFLKNMIKEKYNFSIEAREVLNSTKQQIDKKIINFDTKSYPNVIKIDKLLNKRNELHKETIFVEGILTSININNNYFKIENSNTDDVSGKFEKSLHDELKEYNNKHFIIPSPIVAEVLKISQINHVEEINDIKYELQSFKQ